MSRPAKIQKTTSDQKSNGVVRMTEEMVYLAKKHLLSLKYTLDFDKDILDDEATASVKQDIEELENKLKRWVEEDAQMHDLVKDISELEATLDQDGDLMEAADKKDMEEEIEKKKQEHHLLKVARLDEEGKAKEKKKVTARINTILSEERAEIQKDATMIENLLEMDSELLNAEETEKLHDELLEKLSEVEALDAKINKEENDEKRKDKLEKEIVALEKTQELDADIADEGDLQDELDKSKDELAILQE